ncbi:IS5 family transposase [Kitasatospora sp. NBC_00374]
MGRRRYRSGPGPPPRRGRWSPSATSALLPVRNGYAESRPLGCHRRRVPDRTVFEYVVLALVHGSGYERIAGAGCSDRTIRRRVKQWAELGISEKVHALALEAYDRVIGLGLSEISVDGCITKAPSGGDKAGRSPVDRGKQGLKRSVASDACGVPLGIVSDGADRHDSPLLGPTLDAARAQVGAMPETVSVNLDRGYDSAKSRLLIAGLGFAAEIARKGVPAPIQAGKRWVVERTHSWMNGYGKLRRCTERSGEVVDFYLYLAATLVTLRMLIRRSTSRYRWDGRPTTRRLK